MSYISPQKVFAHLDRLAAWNRGETPAPVTVEIPGRTALLLLSLAKDLGVSTPGEVVMQALGVLQTLRQAKAAGQRVLLRDPSTGAEVDVAL